MELENKLILLCRNLFQRALYGHLVEGETELLELPLCKKFM